MNSSVQPVRYVEEPIRSLSEVISDSLRERILDGTFTPGTELRQEELASRFGASRVPLREAMNRLEAEGLVTLRPRRGYVVTSLDLNEISEIFDLRMVIEEHAGYVATLVRGKDDIEAVRTILDKLEALKPGSETYRSDWAVLNREFHSRLFASSRRMHLSRIAETLRNKVELYIRVESAITGNFREAQADHRKIFDAFAAGHAELVAKLSRDHCEKTARRLIKGLKLRHP